MTAYHLDRADAPFRTAGFVVLAVIMRPIGGRLPDRFGPIPVRVAVYSAVPAFALLAFKPALLPVGTMVFLGMAAALRTGTGRCSPS